MESKKKRPNHNWREHDLAKIEWIFFAIPLERLKYIDNSNIYRRKINSA